VCIELQFEEGKILRLEWFCLRIVAESLVMDVMIWVFLPYR
jgi:hypothetical protein